MIITAIGVTKGAVEIGRQIADIAASAEDIAAELRAEIASLLSRYKNVKSGAVGSAEMSVTPTERGHTHVLQDDQGLQGQRRVCWGTRSTASR